MSEAQIERIVERRMDELDKRLLTGSLTEEQYWLEIRLLDQWAQNCSSGRWG